MHISEELYYIDKLGSLMNFCGKWRRTLWSWSVDIFCIFSTSSSSLNTKQLCWWHKSLNLSILPTLQVLNMFWYSFAESDLQFWTFFFFDSNKVFFNTFFLNVDLGDVLLKFKHQNKLYDNRKMIFLTHNS